ncbi:HSF-type DNA-binding protein [Nitzschia inconspicua]|uniref:HSF-type DNA-binding protein n=1 Tax=Nitzschia inconspicua TaxID=303405 RepID=A0A9K3L0H7_9STRA|nr:HSF-type DNA-binding protein [Nitzschia inconspicua]KAG7353092.1 HSF-type DNA-binding protein [Nitzschia inconspicua]
MNLEQQLQLLAAELQRRTVTSRVNGAGGASFTAVNASGTLLGSRISTNNAKSPTTSEQNNSSSSQLFPYILHGLLEDLEKLGHNSIISWSTDGSAIQVKNEQLFESTLLPSFFPQLRGPSGYSKFQSQLKDWGFDQLGPGIFLHPCFQKSKASMCRFMRGGKYDDQAKEARQAITSSQSILPCQTPASSSFNVALNDDLLQQSIGQPSLALQLQMILQSSAASSNQQQTDALTTILLSQLLGPSQQQHKQGQNPPSQPSVSQFLRSQGSGSATLALPLPSVELSQVASAINPLPPQVQPTLVPAAVINIPSTLEKSSVQPTKSPVMTTEESPPSKNKSASAKRKAFLNKRSRASGTLYRAAEKKQKLSAASNPLNCGSESSSSIAANAPRDKNAFILNESFHQGELPDLLFPWKLHDLLDDADKIDSINRIIRWNEDGVSFSIHDETKFSNEIMTEYFEEKDWDSFTRSLSNWGFVRFTSGAQKGSFIHRLLAKRKRSLCKQMRIHGKAVSELIKNYSQFPGRLHAMLQFAEKSEMGSIVSWTKDGERFTIRDPPAFMNSLFSDYFDHMTFGSFEQKLRKFGFTRSPVKLESVDKETKITTVIYSHPCFKRSKAPTMVWAKSSSRDLSTIRPEHNFLVRLRVLLDDAARDGNQLIVSWLPHGKGFTIHDRACFTDTILPRYFKGKFTSFRQALRNHGFAQMGGNNWDEGAHYHKFFSRDEPLLCQGLTQEQMKKAMPEYVTSGEEPNFYSEQDKCNDVGRDSTLLDAANSIVSLKSSTES